MGCVGEKRKVSYRGEVSARPPLQSPPCHLRCPTFSPPGALIPLLLAGGINPPPLNLAPWWRGRRENDVGLLLENGPGVSRKGGGGAEPRGGK